MNYLTSSHAELVKFVLHGQYAVIESVDWHEPPEHILVSKDGNQSLEVGHLLEADQGWVMYLLVQV